MPYSKAPELPAAKDTPSLCLRIIAAQDGCRGAGSYYESTTYYFDGFLHRVHFCTGVCMLEPWPAHGDRYTEVSGVE